MKNQKKSKVAFHSFQGSLWNHSAVSIYANGHHEYMSRYPDIHFNKPKLSENNAQSGDDAMNNGLGQIIRDWVRPAIYSKAGYESHQELKDYSHQSIEINVSEEEGMRLINKIQTIKSRGTPYSLFNPLGRNCAGDVTEVLQELVKTDEEKELLKPVIDYVVVPTASDVEKGVSQLQELRRSGKVEPIQPSLFSKGMKLVIDAVAYKKEIAKPQSFSL